MERRRFFGILPLGLLGLASTAKGQEPKPEIKKAKMITITGEDGKQYHPLVVEHTETEHNTLEIPKNSANFLFPKTMLM